MNTLADSPRTLTRPPAIVAAIAFAKLGILLWCATAYGYTGPELYILACARRLAWGYVDHGPLAVALLALVEKTYGEGLLSMRAVPAVSGALVVFLTARLARRFGASVFGQGLAALAVAVAPILLGLDHVYGARPLLVLLWTATAGLIARAVTAETTRATRPWVLVGIALGLGVLDDAHTLIYLVGLLVGLALSPGRARLRERGLWLSLGVTAIIAAPYLAWQKAYAWPTWQLFVHHERSTALAFTVGLLTLMLPTNVPLWGAGLWALLVSKRVESYRFLGIAFLVVLVVDLLHGDSPESLAPAFPVLLAAGAAVVDPWLSARGWRYPVAAGLLAVSAAVATPFVLPVLTVAKYEAYAQRTLARLAPDRDRAASDRPPLPAQFAQMYGWPELARTVANVAVALPPEDREDAVVLASNDSEAGAIEFFGDTLGLPPVISGENSFWLWGTLGYTGRVVIAVGGDEAFLRAHFRQVDVATVFGHSLASLSERRVKVYLCIDGNAPLEAMWPDWKRYD